MKSIIIRALKRFNGHWEINDLNLTRHDLLLAYEPWLVGRWRYYGICIYWIVSNSTLTIPVVQTCRRWHVGSLLWCKLTGSTLRCQLCYWRIRPWHYRSGHRMFSKHPAKPTSAHSWKAMFGRKHLDHHDSSSRDCFWAAGPGTTSKKSTMLL